MNALDSGALDKPYREFQGGCCAHCSGEPAAVIPAGFVEGNALYFEEAEYKQLWGDVRPIGMTCSWEPERTTCMATREQVEEAMKRFSSQPGSALDPPESDYLLVRAALPRGFKGQIS